VGCEVVGCVADLRPQKGLQHLVGAARVVLRQRPRTTFVLVGSGEMRPELEALIESHGIADNFKLVGAARPAWEYYARMDLFVLPSLWEGMPYALLEAMAMRRAVVATDVDGSREVVRDGETGLLVPPADEGALAAAILRLLEDEPLRAALGERGRRAVERDYLIGRRIRGLEAIYETLHAEACEKYQERIIP
jgi:glycosyltransferase involved in cell wall biosynthesis